MRGRRSRGLWGNFERGLDGAWVMLGDGIYDTICRSLGMIGWADGRVGKVDE